MRHISSCARDVILRAAWVRSSTQCPRLDAMQIRWQVATLMVFMASGCGRDSLSFGGRASPVGGRDGSIQPFDATSPPGRDAQTSLDDVSFPVPIDGGPFPFDGGRPPPFDGGGPPPFDGGPFPFDLGLADAGFPPLPDATVPDFGVPDGGLPPPPDVGLPPLPDTGLPPPLDAGLPSPDGGSIPDGGIGCASDADCAGLSDQCNDGVCNFALGFCVQRPVRNGTLCNDGSICTINDVCTNGLCNGVSTVPANESCSTAAALTLPVGSTVRRGVTTCAMDDEQGTCGASGGRDVVYQFTLNDPRRVRITTETPATGSSFDTTVYVRSVCAASMSELMCSDDAPGLGRLSRVDDTFDPGTYFAFVDGANGAASGDFQVNFEVDPQNTCANPTEIVPPAANQTVVFRGTTRGGTDDFQGCRTTGAPDHVYRVVLAQDTRLRFETRRTAQQFDTTLHIHGAPCTQGNVPRAFCDDDSGQGTLSLITATLSAGTWFVVVDGFGRGNGRYELAVTTLPPARPPFTITFPQPADLRITATSSVGDEFATNGDLVEGSRTLPVDTWTQAEINLRITNRMTCGTLRIQPQFNRNAAGILSISPGDTSINRTLTLFQPLAGGLTNIRYQVIGTLPANCGSVDFPNGVSTVTFRTN